jgi:hypothetical protein
MAAVLGLMAVLVGVDPYCWNPIAGPTRLVRAAAGWCVPTAILVAHCMVLTAPRRRGLLGKLHPERLGLGLALSPRLKSDILASYARLIAVTDNSGVVPTTVRP